MMNTKKKLEIGYKIFKIYTSKFSFIEEIADEDIDRLILNNKIEVRINTKISLSSNKEVVVDIIATFKNNETDSIFIEHTGRTCFGLQGISENEEVKENKAHDLPQELVTQLFSLSYSHSRALLVNELNPTPFKFKLFLPIIAPDKLSTILKNLTKI